MEQQNPQKPLLIFLSHANEDKPKVRKLYKRLKADGFDPWLDEKRLLPGQNWELEIEKAIRASDVILLCFSELAVSKSGYVQREYKRAMDISLEKPEGAIFVIPVRFDDCEVPNFILKAQWMDYPANYDKLLLSLQSKSGTITKPPKPIRVKPNKQVQKNKKPAALPPNGDGTSSVQNNSITIGNIEIGGDVTGNIHIGHIIQAPIPPPPAFGAPHIPPPVDDFTGRQTELASLKASFKNGVLISGLTGGGGIGKTQLARKLALDLAPSFPDAQFSIGGSGESSACL